MSGDRTSDPGDAILVEGVRLTHPEKPLYAEHGITKSALAAYYRNVAPWILPHIAGRPLSLVRCPEGLQSACFYQKHLGRIAPPAVRQVGIRERQGVASYSVIDEAAGLVALVQIGVLEIHPWGSRVGALERPDRLVFDLDPDPALPWARLVEAAAAMRDDLAALGFQSFPKTTGGKGLHLVVPVAPREDWATAKAFARAFAAAMVDEAPERYTINPLKAERRGKIFLDYLRNDRGATAIAPYSTRAAPGAPVATPLAWSEISGATRPSYTIATIGRRLDTLAVDPWADIDAMEQSITRAARKALGL